MGRHTRTWVCLVHMERSLPRYHRELSLIQLMVMTELPFVQTLSGASRLSLWSIRGRQSWGPPCCMYALPVSPDNGGKSSWRCGVLVSVPESIWSRPLVHRCRGQRSRDVGPTLGTAFFFLQTDPVTKSKTIGVFV